jgi:hypothetical protein
VRRAQQRQAGGLLGMAGLAMTVPLFIPSR